jgi:molybdopterin converting factor small subunit
MAVITDSSTLELHDLIAEPAEEWRRLLAFSTLGREDKMAMSRSAEPLLRRAPELVVQTYDYLLSVPETAAILGWEEKVDEAHLEERRRFFTIWLTRTLGLDTSEEFAAYLFRAGKFHAGHGPRQIHTPSSYVTASIGMVLSAFAVYMSEAGMEAGVLAQAMAGWNKYLLLQLHLMLVGYQVAQELLRGDLKVQVTLFGRLRDILGRREVTVKTAPQATAGDALRKFFNYFPEARVEALERVWQADDERESLWMEVVPIYVPRKGGWRILLNGRNLEYAGGFIAPIQDGHTIAIFPPAR